MRDSLPDHWRESYVCKSGKSMNGTALPMAQKNCCCNIAISLIFYTDDLPVIPHTPRSAIARLLEKVAGRALNGLHTLNPDIIGRES